MRIYSFERSFKWYAIKSTFFFILLVLVFSFAYFKNEEIPPPKLFETEFRSRKLLNDDDPVCLKLQKYEGDKCEFVKKFCQNPLAGGYINYLHLRYCTFKDLTVIYFILIALWLVLMFYLLGDLAETNFCPSLTEISRILRLSPDVAGVTFLALGNGAPDIASVIVGVLSGNADFSIAEPIGAGMFITTAVMAGVSLVSDVSVDPIPFIRDIIVYLITIVYFFVICLTGKMYLWQSILCLVLYGIYVLIVVGAGWFTALISKYKSKLRLVRKFSNSGETQALSLDGKGGYNTMSDEDPLEEHVGWSKKPIYPPLMIQRVDSIPKVEHPENAKYIPKIGVVYTAEEGSLGTAKEVKPERDSAVINESHFDATVTHDEVSDDEQGFDTSTLEGKIKALWARFLDEIEWNEKNWFSKTTFIIVAPTIVIRNLTIPKADPKEWNKWWTMAACIFSPAFAMFATKYYDYPIPGTNFPLVVPLTGAGVLAALFVLLTSSSNQKPLYHFIIVFVSFTLSVLWFYLLANELLSVIQSLGIIFGVSDAILALTVVAWGVSIGDLVADIAIAKAGQPKMAVSACFAGPVLNTLIGLGIGITGYLIFAPYFLIPMSKTLMLSFLVLIIANLASLIVIPLCRFRSPKLHGVLLGILYFAFMVFGVLVELEIIWVS